MNCRVPLLLWCSFCHACHILKAANATHLHGGWNATFHDDFTARMIAEAHGSIGVDPAIDVSNVPNARLEDCDGITSACCRMAIFEPSHVRTRQTTAEPIAIVRCRDKDTEQVPVAICTAVEDARACYLNTVMDDNPRQVNTEAVSRPVIVDAIVSGADVILVQIVRSSTEQGVSLP
jgi:hypothetical protein